MKPKKRVTLDDLAAMVQQGFHGVDQRFDALEGRFDRIEKLVLADHRQRIERLEDDLKHLKSLLAIK